MINPEASQVGVFALLRLLLVSVLAFTAASSTTMGCAWHKQPTESSTEVGGATLSKPRPHRKKKTRSTSIPQTPLPSPTKTERKNPHPTITSRVLKCFSKYYKSQVSENASGPCLQHGDHCLPLWSPAQVPTSDPLIARSVQHLMSQRYVSIQGRTLPPQGYDPGRIRSETLLRATYGQNKFEVKSQLREVQFGPHVIKVHQRVAAPLRKVATRLEKLIEDTPELRPYIEKLGGTFNWRVIAGTDRLSAHSFGIAIDLSPQLGDYWKWQNQKPQRSHNFPMEIVVAFERSGFIWGGRWDHFDTMHFEYRPEFFDDDCAVFPTTH